MSARQTPESFWVKVNKHAPNGCWEWTGCVNNTGYGTVSWHGVVYTAHRVAAFLAGLVDTPARPANAAVPTHVCHKCDNRRCCNPEHFFLGSFSDNQRDAYKKKRKVQPRGQHHANAKLSNEQADEIRAKYRLGIVQVKLAEDYGITQGAVSKILLGKTYIGHLSR
jgi:hypothetical protein